MPNSKHSVFAKPRLKAQRSSRNPFDLSQKRVYHCSLGEILPIYHTELNAGDYIEINETNQTYNLNPLVRPAFSRIKEHIDYFAIPKVQLWSLNDNFITGQSQYMSSALSQVYNQDAEVESVPNQCPMFTGAFLKEVLKNAYNVQNPFGVSELNGVLKLLDLLGYGNYYGYLRAAGSVDEVDSFLTDAGIENLLPQNLWNLLAFQKVYYSYYRNSSYEKNTCVAYNLDWLTSDNYFLSTASQFNSHSSAFYQIFRPHFRWLKKDYFMSVKPSVLPTSSEIGFDGLNMGLQNGMNNAGASVNTVWQVFSLPGMGTRSIYTYGQNSPAENVGQNVGVTGNAGSSYSLTNVSALRFAFAYDKLLRRMREAGQTFDAQMLSQFGITPVDYRHGDAYYLGGFTNRLNINEVVQTGLGNDIEALGQFGANISKFSANNNKISYHAKENVIILGIYSTSYDVDYSSQRYERENLRRYRFDYYNPAFENLGCQALYAGELSMLDNIPSDNQFNIQNNAECVKLLGYQKRYLDYKTKVDVINGLIDYGLNNESMQAWSTQYKPFVLSSDASPNIQEFIPLSQKNMLVSPIVMNDITTADYDGSWERDHFLVNMFNDIRVMSNMSIDGENF